MNSYSSGLVLAGQYADALTATDDEIRHARDYRLRFVLPHAHIYRAGALWGLRRFRQALATVDQAEKANRDPRDGLVLMNIGALRARLHLSVGSADRALDALERYESEYTPRGMEAEYYGWWALAYACAGDEQASVRAAEKAEELSTRIEVRALVPWARAVLDAMSGGDCADAVHRAYAATIEAGNIDAFVAAYRAWPQVLKLLCTDAAKPRRLRTILLSAADHALAQTMGLRVRAPVSNLAMGPLSKREDEVIKLLVSGASNKEIAQTLFLSEVTVKTHLRSIYRKIGVRSRTEAVVWALEDR